MDLLQKKPKAEEKKWMPEGVLYTDMISLGLTEDEIYNDGDRHLTEEEAKLYVEKATESGVCP